MSSASTTCVRTIPGSARWTPETGLAVLGSTLARELFGDRSPLGEVVRIGPKRATKSPRPRGS